MWPVKSNRAAFNVLIIIRFSSNTSCYITNQSTTVFREKKIEHTYVLTAPAEINLLHTKINKGSGPLSGSLGNKENSLLERTDN